jgi:hypothetical protein
MKFTQKCSSLVRRLIKLEQSQNPSIQTIRTIMSQPSFTITYVSLWFGFCDAEQGAKMLN